MSLQLARDLFLRYTLPGQLVLDPFFGRGTSLVGCLLGRDVIGVELESTATGGSPFVEYARENWAHLQAHTLPGLPMGQATILQGDSRHLPLPDAASGEVAGVVSSPPYSDADQQQGREKGARGGDSKRRAKQDYHRYDQPGNLALLPYVAAAIGSPPFADSGPASHDDIYTRGEDPSGQAHNGRFRGGSLVKDTYQAAGNVGKLPAGEVAAAITSPPYQDARGDWPTPEGAGNVRYGSTPGQIGGLAAGDVAAVVSSPPYADGVQARDRLAAIHRAIAEGRASPEVVARFAGLRAGDAGGDGEAALLAADGYGTADGQIGRLPVGDVSAVVTSSPYADVASRNRSQEPYCLAQDPLLKARYGTGDTARHVDGYGGSPGQIGSLPHHAADSGVVTSPPYGPSLSDNRTEGAKAAQLEARIKAGVVTEGKDFGRGNGFVAKYSDDQDNIGNLPHDTPTPGDGAGGQPPENYSSAMLAVLIDCYRVVRPGGVLVLVVGNLVRDGRMIDLAADTIALAVAAGWTPWERWRHEKAQISFWRRLRARQAAAKGLDPAAVTVTHEDVLVFVKGQAPAWEFAELPPTTRAPVSVAALAAPAGVREKAPSMAPLFTLTDEPGPREASPMPEPRAGVLDVPGSAPASSGLKAARAPCRA